MPYAPLPAIAEDLDALRERLQRERHAERARRLHMLLLFKKDPSHTRQDVAEHLAVHRNTIRRWLARYQRGGLDGLLRDGLLRIEKRGPKPGQRTVPEPALRALKACLRDRKGFSGHDQIQRWLREEFGLEVSYKSVYNLVRYHLGAKLKVPRPKHPEKA